MNTKIKRTKAKLDFMTLTALVGAPPSLRKRRNQRRRLGRACDWAQRQMRSATSPLLLLKCQPLGKPVHQLVIARNESAKVLFGTISPIKLMIFVQMNRKPAN